MDETSSNSSVEASDSSSVYTVVIESSALDAASVGVDCTVDSLLPNSELARCGVAPSDRIIECNSERVTCRADLRMTLMASASSRVNLTLRRPQIASPPSVRSTPQRSSARVGGSPTGAEPLESLFEVESITSPTMGFDKLPLDSSARHVTLHSTLRSMEAGRALIVLSEECNPMGTLELLALSLSQRIVIKSLDFALKMRERPTSDELFHQVTAALTHECAHWLVFLNATKSIKSLSAVSNALRDAREMKNLNNDSRVVIFCQPHPHFPQDLLERCCILRLTFSALHKQVLEETFHNSTSKIHLLRGTEKVESPILNKHVKMSAAVEVVSLSSTQVSTSSSTFGDEEGAELEPGTFGIRKTYKGFHADNFVSISRAGDERIAFGTASGNIHICDYNGLALLVFNAHSGCIWDMDFISKYRFVSASEDTSVRYWAYDSAHGAGMGFTGQSISKVGVAFFASKMLGPRSDVVAYGGLHRAVHFSSLPEDATLAATTLKPIDLGSSVQTIGSVSDSCVAVGGGTGLLAVVDPNSDTPVVQSEVHGGKIPCLASLSLGSTFVTGSFDRCACVWDLRTAVGGVMTPVDSLAHKAPITGICAVNNLVGTCSGTSLYLWDIRSTLKPLHKERRAWGGLTRGIEFLGPNQLVTASTDGTVRYWSY